MEKFYYLIFYKIFIHLKWKNNESDSNRYISAFVIFSILLFFNFFSFYLLVLGLLQVKEESYFLYGGFTLATLSLLIQYSFLLHRKIYLEKIAQLENKDSRKSTFWVVVYVSLSILLVFLAPNFAHYYLLK
jgi:hypothetical protein